MDVLAVDKRFVLELVRKRLLDGWVLVVGSPGCVQALEDTVYTPGTPANADFELIIAIARSGGIAPLYLARKTERLNQLLPELSSTEWETLLALELAGTPGECTVQALGAKQGRIAEAVERLINYLSENLA